MSATHYDIIEALGEEDMEKARAVRMDALEDAAQVVRYYLKHQNFEGERSAYQEGVEAACENLASALLEKAACAATWRPREP